MPTAVRLSTSASSGSPFAPVSTFDLTIEGLSRDNARILTKSAEDLMLGVPVVFGMIADVPRPNPLAELDEDTQKTVAVVVLSYFRMTKNKIACIKMLRTLYPGTGLKDGKDFTDFAITITVNDRSESTSSTTITDFDHHMKPLWVKL